MSQVEPGLWRDRSPSSPFTSLCLHHYLWAALSDPPNQPRLSPGLSWVSPCLQSHSAFPAQLLDAHLCLCVRGASWDQEQLHCGLPQGPGAWCWAHDIVGV